MSEAKREGNLRNSTDWLDNDPDYDLIADRGYTGHEHLTEFGLINMNGRVYDPVIGRFLSPDPFVQAPGQVDGYNRYAYVMNNPFRYTDPSGYWNIEEWYAAAYQTNKPRPAQDGSGGGGGFSFSSGYGIGVGGYTPGPINQYYTNNGKYYTSDGDYANQAEAWYELNYGDAELFEYRVVNASRFVRRGEDYGKNKSEAGITKTYAIWDWVNVAANGGGQTQELIPNSDVYYGLVGTSWLWSGTAALNAPHFRVDAASKSAGKLVGKMGVGLNWVATAAEGYDLYNNWDQAGTSDVAKFGVDATITVLTTILYISGVGAPVAVVLTGIQVANTLGAFDSIYESFNEPINNGVNGGGGSW